MVDFIKHPLLTKIISFLVSIIIVLIIFVGIVGIIFPLMMEARVEHVRIISLMPTLIGALIILTARRCPLMRFTYFIKNKKYDTKIYDFIGSLIIGFSLLAAGLLYMRFKNSTIMIIPLICGVLLIRLTIFYINHKIKKQPRHSLLHQEEE